MYIKSKVIENLLSSPLFWSEEPFRVGGRVRHTSIPFDAVHPMFLPKDHPISTLIVRYYHETLCPTSEILDVISNITCPTSSAQVCWLPQAKEAHMQQPMAYLPKEHLTPYEPPFSYTVVDFFGPFYVKREWGSEKAYGCLFSFNLQFLCWFLLTYTRFNSSDQSFFEIVSEPD